MLSICLFATLHGLLNSTKMFSLFLQNIPLNASNDTLENYLEVICDTDVDSIYFHQLPDHNHVREVAVVFLREKVKGLSCSLEVSFINFQFFNYCISCTKLPGHM